MTDDRRSWILRPATDADVADVSTIERGSFSDPWPMRSFLDLLHHDRCWFAVAESKDSARVAGYVILLVAGEDADLLNLAVARDARGRGIGATLLDHALAEARGRGVRDVYLEVRDSNGPARSLYASRGFVEVGRRRQYYRQPREDGIILRWSAPSSSPTQAHTG